ATGAGAARSDADEEAADARGRAAHPAHPEDAGGRQYQAHHGDRRHYGRERRILKARVEGETRADTLAELGSQRLKCPKPDLIRALEGRVTAHHRFLIGHHLGLIEELERRIAAFA